MPGNKLCLGRRKEGNRVSDILWLTKALERRLVGPEISKFLVLGEDLPGNTRNDRTRLNVIRGNAVFTKLQRQCFGAPLDSSSVPRLPMVVLAPATVKGSLTTGAGT